MFGARGGGGGGGGGGDSDSGIIIFITIVTIVIIIIIIIILVLYPCHCAGHLFVIRGAFYIYNALMYCLFVFSVLITGDGDNNYVQ